MKRGPGSSWIAALALLLLFALPAWVPSVAWRLQPAKALDVVVVDKATPFEHAAIPWLLQAMKIVNKEGRFLDSARDYVGFDAAIGKGRDLTDEDLADADVLVMRGWGADPLGLDRSPPIHRGLTDDESSVVDAFAARGGMVLGDVSALASGDDARRRLEALFGVRWTKWLARYWTNLRDPNEVPRWVGEVYERVNGRPFDLQGGGVVFVQQGGDIVVLRDHDDLRTGGILQERTRGGAVLDLPERGEFASWMDVVESVGSEVVCEHVVATTQAGEQKLVAHGLSPRFPAVTRRWNAWYFAGDFDGEPKDLGNPERAWLLAYRQAEAGCSRHTANEGFFWGWYMPIVSRLLASHAK